MIEDDGKNNLKNSIKKSRKPNLTELGIIYLTILVPINSPRKRGLLICKFNFGKFIFQNEYLR